MSRGVRRIKQRIEGQMEKTWKWEKGGGEEGAGVLRNREEKGQRRKMK